MLKETKVAVSNSQVSTDLGDEIAILNLDSGVYSGLSDVGACVWNLIDEPKTVAQIHESILSQYEVTSETLFNDLTAFLNQLADAGLICLSNENSL
jgi:Coenzyme PQQ synthesis protein D (PqqD)